MVIHTATRPRIVSVLTALTVTVLVAMFAELASATFPGRNGRLAVSHYWDSDCGERRIVTMRPDGTDRRRTIRSRCPDDGTFAEPDWSPDGRRLAYLEVAHMDDGGRIALMRADGSRRRVVPLRGLTPADEYDEYMLDYTAASAPSFSPTGTSIAYVRWIVRDEATHPRSGIWVANLDGSRDRFLASRGTSPSWSPTGRRIAYLAHISSSDRELRLISARTGELIRSIPTSDMDWPADWSPDGRQLLYAGPRYDGDLWVVRADGTGSRRLLETSAGQWPSEEGSRASGAVWSPDGRRIAFVSMRRVPGERHGSPLVRHSIWTMNADGTNPTQIWEGRADLNYGAPELAWQPRPR